MCSVLRIKDFYQTDNICFLAILKATCGILSLFCLKFQVTEWLCLNCQMQRAHDNASVVPQKISGQPHSSPKAGMTLSLQHKDAYAVDSTKKITKPITASPQKENKFGAIQKTEQQQMKAPNDSPPLHKRQHLETGKPQGDISKTDKSETKDESGFFGFGFGGARSRSPSPKPASAVSGKILGFGTSFLSSASDLISSAVMDEPSTTPQASRKGSSISESSISSTTPPFSRKGSAVSQTLFKTALPTSYKGSSVSQTSNKTGSSTSMPVSSHKRTDISQDIMTETKKSLNEKAEENKFQEPQQPKTLSEKVKESAAVEKSSNQLPKTCPLCTTDIKKDPPNYSTCTECKSIVCDLCGFSPMPLETEVSLYMLLVGLHVC